MDSQPTLHEFVLTLLSDPDARTAFQLDPEGTLHAAGLSDINAMDVQEAIPLVADYVPVQNVVDTISTTAFPTGALRADPGAAIQQLVLVTQHLPGLNQNPLASDLTGTLTSDLNLAATGTLAGSVTGSLLDPTALTGSSGLAGSLPGVLSGGDFSAIHDVTDTLDGGAHTVDPNTITSTVTTTVNSAVSTVDTAPGSVSDTLNQTTHTVTSTVDGTLSGTLTTVGSLPGTLDATLDPGHLLGLGDPTGISTAVSAHASADATVTHDSSGDHPGLLSHTPLSTVTDSLTDGHLLDLGHLL